MARAPGHQPYVALYALEQVMNAYLYPLYQSFFEKYGIHEELQKFSAEFVLSNSSLKCHTCKPQGRVHRTILRGRRLRRQLRQRIHKRLKKSLMEI